MAKLVGNCLHVRGVLLFVWPQVTQSSWFADFQADISQRLSFNISSSMRGLRMQAAGASQWTQRNIIQTAATSFRSVAACGWRLVGLGASHAVKEATMGRCCCEADQRGTDISNSNSGKGVLQLAAALAGSV
jgi:hypothetical protein